ncbi:hypothetical protein D8674_038110 [Pyrus ussuriensis x Pyrus communis]|uniref:Uncharacterized protein n=1 Tax=Pyrus ussuriensis x Pyrus communis TaxID=2448454 RepID=A0A5N5I372_9ROSA|nr:hypothetical protein D8674_038110 [Pyrus ussuriensis x Pyrus communis]
MPTSPPLPTHHLLFFFFCSSPSTRIPLHTPNLPSPAHCHPLFLHLHVLPSHPWIPSPSVELDPDAQNSDVDSNPDGVFVGSGVFKSDNLVKQGRAIVQAVMHSRDPNVLAKVSYKLGEAMVGFKGLFRWIVDVVFLVGVDMGKRGRRWVGEGRLFGGGGGDTGG